MGVFSWTKRPFGGPVVHQSSQWWPAVLGVLIGIHFLSLVLLELSVTLAYWLLISYRVTRPVLFAGIALMASTRLNHARLLATVRSSRGASIWASIGMQMWPAAWPLHYNRPEADSAVASLVLISTKKTNTIRFWVCHTGDKCTGHLLLFKDLSDLSVNTRVIKELFKGTVGAKVMSDKWAHTGSSSVWFINFVLYFGRPNCTKLLWLMYYF